MNAQINRRCLLSLAPAALAVGAVPAMAMQVAETPVMRAYRAYVAHREWINATDLSEEEMDAATAKIDDLLNAITSAPSASPVDTAIKFYAVTVDYEALYDDPHREALEAEARALIA